MAELRDVKIKFVSLVKKAANKHSFCIVKSDGACQLEAEIIKADDDKRLVTSIVYEPNTKDSHGDFMTAEEIERAAHDFLVNGKGADIQHNYQKANIDIVESWVSKTDTIVGGQEIKKGTWMATAKINDDVVWKAVKSGEITGFSMGGTGVKVNKTEEEDIKMTTEELKKAMEEVLKGVKEEKKPEELKKFEDRLAEIEKELKNSKAKEPTEEEKKAVTEKEKEIKDLKDQVNKMSEQMKEMSQPGVINKADEIVALEKAEKDYSEKLNKATLADGAAIIPTPIANQIIKNIKEIAPFFKAGTHIQGKGTTITVPVRLPNTITSAKAKKEGEETEVGTINLKKITLAKGVVQSVIPITDELRRDSLFNIAGIVREYSTEDIAEYIAENTVKGVVDMSDADKPNRIEGFQSHADFMAKRTVEQANADVITWDELMKIKKEVSPQYRQGAVWYISPEAELILKTMKDLQGRPLWQASLVPGQPATFDGNPIEVMWQMGAAAGDVMVLFANFSRFYYYYVDYEMESEIDRKAVAGFTNELLRSRMGGKVANELAAYGIKKKVV